MGLAPVQKLKKGRALVGFPNAGPTVVITGQPAAPAAGAPTAGYTATAVDPQQGDLSAGLIWIGDSVLAAAGFQDALTGGVRVGGDVTGLVNDATVYTATVTVDGGAGQPIAITGSTAQDYTTLLAELNIDTTGAVWSLSGGNLRCLSDSTGVASTVLIVDTDLLATLTDFTAIDAASAGTDVVVGTIGTGAAPTLTLVTTGAQTIRAEVTDSYGVVGFDTSAITSV